MTPLRLILAEITHRRVNALLGVLAVATVVTFGVELIMSQEAARRETRRVTRDLGFNVRIVPRDTDESRFHFNGYSQETMAEDAVQRMASSGTISYNHLVATLKQRIELGGAPALLVGISGTYFPSGQKKPPMMFTVDPGTVHVGAQVAGRLGIDKGSLLDLRGESFSVVRVMPKGASQEDVTVYGLLSDVQRVLGLPGRINEIMAIDCLCQTSDQNPAQTLSDELARVLPEARVLHLSRMADTRARQRRLADASAELTTSVAVLVCAILVGVLAVLNVRERRGEIGLLRALGYRSAGITTLFLGRAVLIGLVGAMIGFAVGTWLVLRTRHEMFPVTGSAVRIDWLLLGLSMLGAPVFAALASFIPAMMAVTQDPAETLTAD